MRIETADQLRICIDQGKAGDKVDFPDPSAAPLGTDDEAGGHPPTKAQVRLAASHELSAPTKSKQMDKGIGQGWWVVGYAVVFAAAIVVWTSHLPL